MLRRLGFVLLGMLVLGLIALNVMAWSGALIDEEAAVPQQTVPVEATPPPLESELTQGQAPPEAKPIVRKRPAKPRAKPAPNGTTLTLAATRGDCWIEVRAGSSTGPSLYAGTLASGSTLKFSRPRLWLRLGAASNVDIMVNGRPSTVPSGTVELTVPDA